MADLNTLQSALMVQLIGSDSTGIETNPVASSTTGDLGVSDGISSGGTQGALSLTANTAVELKVGASRLSSRKLVTCTLLFNSSVIVYWGYTSGVTVATGSPMLPGMTAFALDATDANATIYIVAAAATSVRVTESP